MGVFNRDFMHANGSGKSNLSNGGNEWIYRSGDATDLIATLRGSGFFLPFKDALEVGDILKLIPGNVNTNLGFSQITAISDTAVTQATITLV